MKKLLSITFAILMAFIVVGSAEAVSPPDHGFGKVEQAGGVGGRNSDSPRIIRVVRYANQGPNVASLDAGDAVGWSTISDDGVTIDLVSTVGHNSFAGILATAIQTADATGTSAQDDFGRRNWGYLVTNGLVDADITANMTFAAGDPVYLSADSGTIGNETAAAAANGRNGGIALDATTTETTVQVLMLNE